MFQDVKTWELICLMAIFLELLRRMHGFRISLYPFKLFIIGYVCICGKLVLMKERLHTVFGQVVLLCWLSEAQRVRWFK